VSADVYLRLAVIMATVVLGAALTRLPVFARPQAGDPGAAELAMAMGQLTTYVLVPALLFRTMARLDLSHMPWPVAQAYFAPVLVGAVLVVLAFKRRSAPVGPQAPAAAATRATAAVYGNGVLLGIPMATAVFGEPGLAVHIALVSLHGLLLLTLLTMSAEVALARAGAPRSLWATLSTMVNSTVMHPVVLPVLAGLAWNLTGWPLPELASQILAGLGAPVVPLCLLLIGMNLAQYGWRGTWRPALPQVLFKLLILPAAVLISARYVFALEGLALQVAVMMAALPVGTNALIMAQRYRLLQAEATTAIVMSTLAFAITAPMWLWVLSRLSGA
jgi:predicted permease